MRLLAVFVLGLQAVCADLAASLAPLAPPMAALEAVLEATLLYAHAMLQLAQLPPKYHGQTPVYTHKNLHLGVRVPQYDADAHEYIGSAAPNEPQTACWDALEKLETAAGLGSADAALALADIYTFGNFSVPTNYTRACEWYHLAVENEDQKARGHAYYMLGFMAQTGLFGELPVDRQRAKVYFEFAARNGNTNALLVLAYQHLHGVECPVNCGTAQFYYLRLARQVIQQLDDTGSDVRDELLSYNINLADFHGGIYGEKISELESSVRSDMDNFVQLRDSLREKNLDSPDSQILDLYFDALEHFHGGYFSPLNASRAYQEALACAYLGQQEFADTRASNPSNIDKYIWMKCQSLVGRMYLNGEGVERNIPRAHFWLSEAVALRPDKDNLLDMALLRSLDPTSDGKFSPACTSYLQSSAKNASSHGIFLYAKSLIAPESPFETLYVDLTYDLIRASAYKGHYQSTFYLADAIESGFAASKGETFSCAELLLFYKSFVERSESFLLPHLAYAFEELTYGNYKNALLGFLMAAEQGLMNSQLSAAYLLYQVEPLFTWEKKTFHPDRVSAALKYLDLASSQGHIDSTILLGDLYAKGLPESNVSADYNKAFAYYNTAALSASAHACYKLGYMYEYGMGSANNSVDYNMAKRYYDLSVKYYQDLNLMNINSEAKTNTYALGFALVRLRFKYLFSRAGKPEDPESSGWLGTLRKLAKSSDTELVDEKATEKATAKAQAHAEGSSYDDDNDDDYQLFDYIVLIFTMAFFLYIGFQNLRGQFRRVGQRPVPDGAGHANGANGANAANAANPPRFQVEFFFAI